MNLLGKIEKAMNVAARPTLGTALLRYGVAAAVEHLEAIRLMRAETLIDIGANKGQFSLAFRYTNRKAMILAFEPLATAASRYLSIFRNDKNVLLHQVALSARKGQAEFFVTDRQDSSSLFRPGEGELQAFGVREQQAIQVPIDRLDSVVDFAKLARPITMKIDVQGAELDVLKGCDVLHQVDFVYVELSFVSLYEGQPLYGDVSDYLQHHGFVLAGVFNQVSTDCFGPTQADFLFKRVKTSHNRRD